MFMYHYIFKEPWTIYKLFLNMVVAPQFSGKQAVTGFMTTEEISDFKIN